MRRGLVGFCLLACCAAGLLSALSLGSGSASGSPGTTMGTTGTTTTATTTTTTTTTTPTTTTPTTTTPPPQAVVAEDVKVGGVDVGGFARADATQLVRAHFEASLKVVLGGRAFLVAPARLGATARVGPAVDRALDAVEGTRVPLNVSVNRARTRAWVRGAAQRFDRTPVDSEIQRRGLHPFVTKGRPGRAVSQRWATLALVNALRANSRNPVRLPFRPLQQRITRANAGPVIVIRRESKRLWLYRGMKHWRTFGVAVGQSAYPTPLGRHEIVVMWRHPWWYPPDSDWAQGAWGNPIPPGPGNPLGTRWMGLSSPGVGIHGTPNPSSIGYSASHGCIRMLIPQAEWLFNHVEIGTTVFIVPA